MRIDTETVAVTCPYCGEHIELIVDLSVPQQEYVEDCSVCCRPIVVAAEIDDDQARVTVRGEDET
jgi:hypothetical protein